MHQAHSRLLCPVAAALLAVAAQASVELPAILGSHMVLQRDQPCPIWGRATPGEEVTVTFGKQHIVTKAGKDGRFRVTLAPSKAGGPYDLAVQGTNRIVLKDILVGEVWVCSGQSNMDFNTRAAINGAAEKANAVFPKIRLFKVMRAAKPEPQSDCKGRWERCSPETVGKFSAVGYFFGRELHRHLHDGLDRVPVGLIHTAWGGTPVEAWTRPADVAATPDAGPLIARWKKAVAQYPQARKAHERKVAAWREAAAEARKAGRRAPRRPRGPRGPNHPHRPGNLYNGMILPLVPFAMRGAIWYQGESNASRAYQYRTLFPAMIENWRRIWKRDFPFGFVQLANYTVGGRQDHTAWAELREAQNMALALPAVGMAVTIDIGNAHDIHPKNKQEVGRRLGLWARAAVYGEKLAVWSGPIYDAMKRTGRSIEISFRHVGAGLKILGGKTLHGFQIAAESGGFRPAKARIAGDKVIVSSPDVKTPVAVRYAWLDNPTCNLGNTAGLPASPFRTDDWPGVTANNK